MRREKKYENTCLVCGSVFMGANIQTKYCSARCNGIAQYLKRHADDQPKICEKCGCAITYGMKSRKMCPDCRGESKDRSEKKKVLRAFGYKLKEDLVEGDI